MGLRDMGWGTWAWRTWACGTWACICYLTGRTGFSLAYSYNNYYKLSTSHNIFVLFHARQVSHSIKSGARMLFPRSESTTLQTAIYGIPVCFNLRDDF